MLRFPFSNLIKNVQSSHFQSHIHFKTEIWGVQMKKQKIKKQNKKHLESR